MDCTKNIDIVRHDRKLKELWSWMKIADQISTKLSKIGSTDYSFYGIYGIWMGSQHRHRSSPASTPRQSHSPKPSRQLSHPMKLSDTESNPLTDVANDLPMVETARSAQRIIALSVCGFAFDTKGFENELIQLESRGEYYKAASLALFHGNPTRAIQALSSARGRDNKEGKYIHIQKKYAYD